MSATPLMEVDPISDSSVPNAAQDKEENASTSQKSTTGNAPLRPCGLREVSPRGLAECKQSPQLLAAILDAMLAHKRLFQDAGILHGDININTIIIIDEPDGKTHGALVDFDMPFTPAAMRKAEKPDPASPPEPRLERRHYYWQR